MRAELTVLNKEEFQKLLVYAPKAMTDAMAHWMWRERRSFVGNKKQDGAFRKTLGRKERKYYQGNWGVGMRNAFQGVINHPNVMDGMTLTMGVNDRWLKKIPALSLFATGGEVTPRNSKWLMIPNYRNLESIRSSERIGGNIDSKQNWSKWRKENAHSLFGFMFHGKFLIFGDAPKGEKRGDLRGKLLFVGVKRSKIPKQFDFVKRFEGRKAGMLKRAENMVTRTIRGIERGKVELK